MLFLAAIGIESYNDVSIKRAFGRVVVGVSKFMTTVDRGWSVVLPEGKNVGSIAKKSLGDCRQLFNTKERTVLSGAKVTMTEAAVDGYTVRSTGPGLPVALRYFGVDFYGDLPMNGRNR